MRGAETAVRVSERGNVDIRFCEAQENVAVLEKDIRTLEERLAGILSAPIEVNRTAATAGPLPLQPIESPLAGALRELGMRITSLSGLVHSISSRVEL